MFDLINNRGDVNGIGTEEGTQDEAYNIDRKPLFDVPLANCMAFYANGREEDGSKEEDIEADLDAVVLEDVVVDTTTAAKKKKISKRSVGYTPKEDVCLC
jgi:hypothetical protein